MKYMTTRKKAPEPAFPDIQNRAVQSAVIDVLSARTDAPGSREVLFRGMRYSVYWGLSVQAGITVIVVSEGTPAPPQIEIPSCYRLTPRECEVARLLALRYSNKEIASLLGISPHTAWRHTDNVLGKLGVSTRRHVMDLLRRST